jgi:predicted enzyme related to lactoylglutathione lyase
MDDIGLELGRVIDRSPQRRGVTSEEPEHPLGFYVREHRVGKVDRSEAGGGSQDASDDFGAAGESDTSVGRLNHAVVLKNAIDEVEEPAAGIQDAGGRILRPICAIRGIDD